MPLSPTQRTLQALRNRGMLCERVERWNQFAGPHGVRQDMFGFGDVVALDPERPAIVAIQCCAGSGMASHRKKIVEACFEAALQWLLCGGAIELWGWRKVLLRRDGKAKRWKPRVEIVRIVEDRLICEPQGLSTETPRRRVNNPYATGTFAVPGGLGG